MYFGPLATTTPAVFDGLAFSADSTVEAFEGASAQAIADTTDGAAEGNYVIEYTKTPTSKSYAGVTVGNLEGNLVDAIPFDIDGGATVITARIYTDAADKVVRMQVADSASDNDANWVHAQATLENVGWNTVTFDFASPVARWVTANNGESAVALSADVTYDEISIFPDWENGLDWQGNAVGTALTEDAVYLIDDVKMAEATPIDLTLTFGADDGSGYALTDFGGNVSSIVTGNDAPAGSDGSVVKVQKGAEIWAGTTFLELSGDGELISDGYTTVTAEVFSAKDGATVRLKLEDSADGTIFVELDATTESNGSDAWETLTWDLSTATGLDHLNSYNKASIFFDFGNAGDSEDYYLDDVNFSGYVA
jgi:hypothetical protein